MASTAPSLGGTSALATNNDTVASSNIENDPWSTCQSFPETIDEFAVTHMTGLTSRAGELFSKWSVEDGEISSTGKSMLHRDRLKFMAASDLTFALICHRHLDEIAGILDRAPQLLDLNCGRGHKPLHMAVTSGRIDVVTHMLEKGAAVNAPIEPSNVTALHLAYNDPEMVKLLLEYGALPSNLTKWQKSPQDWAAAAPNSKTSPAGRSAILLEEASEDFEGTMRRAKAQQLRIDERRKYIAANAASLQHHAEEKKNEAEEWLQQQSLDEDGYPVEADESTITTLSALAAVRGPQYAKGLWDGVTKAWKSEVQQARKGSELTTELMADRQNDRGLRFEKFTTGKHGGRSVNKRAVQVHLQRREARRLAKKKAEQSSDEEESETQFEESTYADGDGNSDDEGQGSMSNDDDDNEDDDGISILTGGSEN